MSREGERKETGSLPPKGVRAPDWRSLIHCLSLLCLTFQIDISEDDIDDGFRRLFAQLAGEVGVPQISMLWTLLDAKENSLCSQGDFSLKGRGNKLTRSKEDLQMSLGFCSAPLPASSPHCRPFHFCGQLRHGIPPALGFLVPPVAVFACLFHSS